VNSTPTVQVNDTSICQGQSGSITAVGSPTGGTYLWSNGQTSQTITGSPSSTVNLSVTYSLNGCTSLADNAIIFVNPIPAVDLGSDTVLCQNALPYVLSSSVSNPNSNYLWNTGNTSSMLTITNGGQYSLVVTENGCSNTDTIFVSIDPCANLFQLESLGLEIFPNPTNDVWTIASEIYQVDKMELFDCTGKCLIASLPKTTQIILSSQQYTPGVYLLKLRVNGSELIERLIKY
jgi:hypothetical protein